MRASLQIFLFIFTPLYLFAQQEIREGGKPSIDLDALGTWAQIANPSISSNGRYISYCITSQPKGANTFVLRDTKSGWSKSLLVGNTFPEGIFSGDGRKVAWQQGSDLYICLLGTEKIDVRHDVISYKRPRGGNGEWLAFNSGSAKTLILHNFSTGKETEFQSVDDCVFDNEGHSLLLIVDSAHILNQLDLKSGAVKSIWRSDTLQIETCSFDDGGRQLVFTTINPAESDNSRSIWYYAPKMVNAEKRVDKNTRGIDRGLLLSGMPQFSKNGSWIFFQLQKTVGILSPKSDAVKVNIWSYKDLVLQPEQLEHAQQNAVTYGAVINVNGNSVVEIQGEDEFVFTGPDHVTGEHVVVIDNFSNGVPWWRLSPASSNYLVSLKDGSRRLLKKESRTLAEFSISPSGKYLVYYDSEEGDYFSIDTEDGTKRNISKNIPTGVNNEYLRTVERRAVGPVAGWENNDSSLLIYDNYDIWKVSSIADGNPINITNNYGINNRVKFRLIDEGIIYNKDTVRLILTAFDVKTKFNGFYRQRLNAKSNPECLTMGPYTYYRMESQKPHGFAFDNGQRPIKAAEADIWLVKRQSAVEAPNYFVTTNFREFLKLSDNAPQKGYNWLTTELVSWKMLDGQMSQGVLYKPENFDPKKKYPVIFNYYEKLSHRVYEFPYPYYTDGDINIPWFTSNGYLVFTPDIYYSIGSKSGITVGEHAYNSVVSAAEYLKTLPYVDGDRMGLQGHSFGALETNYLITHTGIFAAAAEFAGVTDPVSEYLTLIAGFLPVEHYSTQYKMEMLHELYGATLWERPDLYEKNSAVLNADKITTPLLITHNALDNNIQWRQGIELYLALRRLGKKCWMLEYEESGHGVNGRDARDYTIRLTQFFDHYLKGKPAPIWMTKGIPPRLKGIEEGYTLDRSGICGGGCSICRPSTKKTQQEGRVTKMPRVLSRK